MWYLCRKDAQACFAKSSAVGGSKFKKIDEAWYLCRKDDLEYNYFKVVK